MSALHIVLVSARAARGLDDDEAPLCAAFGAAGCHAERAEWDDPGVDWASFDVALLRSTWDYAERLNEFLAWVSRASALTRVLNPPSVVRWNTDKHYLSDLSQAGIAVVASQFIEPGARARPAIEQFLGRYEHEYVVVKPAVGAGSRDAERHRRDAIDSAENHARRLLEANRSVLLQPYLNRVDQDGETALVFYKGRFDHAVRKGPLLPPGGAATRTLFAPEAITARVPGADELQLAQRAVAAIPFDTPLYARIDLIRDDDGVPCVLELELTEPSLFFAHSPGSAERLAAAVLSPGLLG
jgi:O-ureido-D-serine cyclo-ligase